MRYSMLGRRIALVVFICNGSFSSLHAEQTSPRNLAKTHYQLGRAHLERGEFADAIREFETGYKLKPLPLFIYNIAQVERVAGQTQKALEDYERYLNAEPRAPDRAEVERWIALLRQRLQEAPTPANPAPPATAAEPNPAPGGEGAAVNPAATSSLPAGATAAPHGGSEAANPAATSPPSAGATPSPDEGSEAANAAATNPPSAGATPPPAAARATPAAADATPPSVRVPLTAPSAAVSAPGSVALPQRHHAETRSRRKLWITVGAVGGVLVLGAVVTAIAVSVSSGGSGVPSGYNNWGAVDYHH
jgi:hypothetical protein